MLEGVKMRTLNYINQLFAISNEYTLRFHELSFKSLFQFSLLLSQFERTLESEIRQDILINELISELRRYRFFLMASPLSPHYSKDRFNLIKINDLIKKCTLFFPESKDLLHTLLNALVTVVESKDEPVLNFLKGLIQQDVKTGLVVKVSQSVDLYNRVLAETFSNSIKVVSPLALKNGQIYEQLFIIGPPHWYPDHLYHSPRSPLIDTVIYDWQAWSFDKASHLRGGDSNLYSGAAVIKSSKTHFKQNNKIEVDLLKTDYSGIEENFNRALGEQKAPNKVSTTLVVVSGGKAVFFENHTLDNIWVLQLDEEEKVKRLPVQAINTDCYLLIRTGTGKDLIHLIADEQLGERSFEIRNRHNNWKKQLQSEVYRQGYDGVIQQLRKNGSTRANTTNLRNWMSEDNIKPQKRNDFTAIIKFLKYEEQESSLWEEAEILAKHHIRAGNIIRQQLLEVVSCTDLSKLELETKILFPLPGSNSASFTAFKVEYISRKVFFVDQHQTRNLLQLDGVDYLEQ
ncbi:DUF7764 domain-containing protein [Paenibacillus glycanilyticus]|uniref:DISARM anti-phage system protein DrmE domain-containing protein n=1 Tax=Paenibacillus glycanilyticus TaxID=126569 RepID=UPI003EB8374E